MATGSLVNGIWVYGEDDSEPTASALLNKLANSVANKVVALPASAITSGTVAVARLPFASETAGGIVERASQAEVNTGTDTTRYVTPSTLRNSANIPYSMAAGTGTSSGSGLVTVTFPTSRFSVAPRVTGVQQQQTGGTLGICYIEAVTSTNFKFGLYTLAGGLINSGTINWMAVQMSSSAASG